ncbi:MAG: hypothetical protein ACQERC_08255 [Bacteroidota bacterium]
MNKIYNIWILIFTVLTFPFAIAVGNNLDFTIFGLDIQGEEFAYKHFVFTLSAGIIFLIGALRASKKWVGLRVVRQVRRFKFSTPVSRLRRKRVLLYNMIELFFYLLFAGGLLYFTIDTIYVVLVFVILAADQIIHTYLGIAAKGYRIGLTKNAIVLADRETKAIYFKGLKKISKHQQTIYFEYVNDLVLHFPTNLIPEEEWSDFVASLQEQVPPNRVYYSGF